MGYALAFVVLVAGVDLIELHRPEGQTAYINVHEISELRAPNANDLAWHFTPGVQCIVMMTNAKWLATRESCSEIKAELARR